MGTLRLNLKGDLSSDSNYESEAKTLLKKIYCEYTKIQLINFGDVKQINSLDGEVMKLIEKGRSNDFLVETEVPIANSYKRIIDEKNLKYTIIKQ